MKRICSLFFITGSLYNFCSAQAVVTGSTGANATYATLSAAFTAINGGAIQTGNNILINITTDLSEPATPTALIYRNWSTLTIQPTGVRTISGAPTNQLIGLNGARFVTINGINSGGNTLLINCTNTQPAITLYNAASNNTITDLTVKANTNSLTTGVIFFSNTTLG
ncbi:MAG TPA: hypothetical protein VK489_12540, partial [Ferruginibacter sp.]|nr:hypothetical protein [Ferruginibacter sp.]